MAPMSRNASALALNRRSSPKASSTRSRAASRSLRSSRTSLSLRTRSSSLIWWCSSTSSYSCRTSCRSCCWLSALLSISCCCASSCCSCESSVLYCRLCATSSCKAVFLARHPVWRAADSKLPLLILVRASAASLSSCIWRCSSAFRSFAELILKRSLAASVALPSPTAVLTTLPLATGTGVASRADCADAAMTRACSSCPWRPRMRSS
mmetsp:Transcript_24569/g.70093  ORF Transcript_24569/g.70093 Transcript_24569/m.70093 type:complete len:209 (-) Transcript_24569:899-1525(-)